eukprot:745895-Hanusia_phi.AAC.5
MLRDLETARDGCHPVWIVKRSFARFSSMTRVVGVHDRKAVLQVQRLLKDIERCKCCSWRHPAGHQEHKVEKSEQGQLRVNHGAYLPLSQLKPAQKGTAGDCNHRKRGLDSSTESDIQHWRSLLLRCCNRQNLIIPKNPLPAKMIRSKRCRPA